MKKYGILVIGCGHIGCQHLADIYYRENISIVAVIDVRLEAAKKAARMYNAQNYGTDFRPYLSDSRVDIVIIATYTSTHLAILKGCLAVHKHVLCEKPIASTLKDGQAFYEAVKSADSKVLVAHILRHNQSYIQIQKLIQSGVIGNLRMIRMIQNHHAMDWDRYKRLMEDCPPIVDCGVHYFDVMQWFTGAKIVEVGGFGTWIEPDSACYNYGLVTVKLSSGCIGYYEAGWSRSLASQNLKEFIGDKGRISLELKENRASHSEEGDRISVYHSDIGDYQTINLNSKYKDMYGQLSVLIRMIEQDEPANPTIEEAYSAFLVSMAADRAVREDRVIRIDEGNRLIIPLPVKRPMAMHL